MLPERLTRAVAGRSVHLTFGILVAQGMGDVAYHEGVAELLDFVADPAFYAIVTAYYLFAIPLGAVARWTGVYDPGAWYQELLRLRDGIAWFFGIGRSETRQ